MALNKGIITAAMVASAAVTGAGAQTTQTAKQVNAVTIPVNSDVTIGAETSTLDGSGVNLRVISGTDTLATATETHILSHSQSTAGAIAKQITPDTVVGIQASLRRDDPKMIDPSYTGQLEAVAGTISVKTKITPDTSIAASLTAGASHGARLASSTSTRYEESTNETSEEIISRRRTYETNSTTDYSGGHYTTGRLSVYHQISPDMTASGNVGIHDSSISGREVIGGVNLTARINRGTVTGSLAHIAKGSNMVSLAVAQQLTPGLSIGVKASKIYGNNPDTRVNVLATWTPGATSYIPVVVENTTSTSARDMAGDLAGVQIPSVISLGTVHKQSSERLIADEITGRVAKPKPVVKPVDPKIDTPASVTIATPTITSTSISCSGTVYDVDAPAGFNYDVRCVVRNMSGAIVSATALTPSTSYTYALVYNEWDKVTNTIKLNSTTAARNFTTLAAATPTGPAIADIGPLLDHGGNPISFNLGALAGLPAGSQVIGVTGFPTTDDFSGAASLICDTSGNCTAVYDIDAPLNTGKTLPVNVEVRVPGFTSTLIRPAKIIIVNEA